jgi:hypothetical protein
VHFIKPNTSDNNHEGEKRGSQEDKVKNEEVHGLTDAFMACLEKLRGPLR